MIDIVKKLDEETTKRIKDYPSQSNRASVAGHKCKRYLVLCRLKPELKALHDIGLQRIFDEGNLHEAAVLREIEDAGFKLVEQQRPFSWPKFQLTGRIDAKISANGNLIPLEIKSCSPNVFATLKGMNPEDLIKSKYDWIRRYPAQILCYCIMDGSEEGIIVFKNKSTGEKLQMNFRLEGDNLAYVESILKKLEEVNDWVARGEIPPLDKEECEGPERCGFAKTICFPGKDYGPGYEFFSDEEIEAKLIRREEIWPTKKEADNLDKELKAMFKGRNAIVGDFKIESIEVERKGYAVEAGTYWKTTIEKI